MPQVTVACGVSVISAFVLRSFVEFGKIRLLFFLFTVLSKRMVGLSATLIQSDVS